MQPDLSQLLSRTEEGMHVGGGRDWSGWEVNFMFRQIKFPLHFMFDFYKALM